MRSLSTQINSSPGGFRGPLCRRRRRQQRQHWSAWCVFAIRPRLKSAGLVRSNKFQPVGSCGQLAGEQKSRVLIPSSSPPPNRRPRTKRLLLVAIDNWCFIVCSAELSGGFQTSGLDQLGAVVAVASMESSHQYSSRYTLASHQSSIGDWKLADHASESRCNKRRPRRRGYHHWQVCGFRSPAANRNNAIREAPRSLRGKLWPIWNERGDEESSTISCSGCWKIQGVHMRCKHKIESRQQSRWRRHSSVPCCPRGPRRVEPPNDCRPREPNATKRRHGLDCMLPEGPRTTFGSCRVTDWPSARSLGGDALLEGLAETLGALAALRKRLHVTELARDGRWPARASQRLGTGFPSACASRLSHDWMQQTTTMNNGGGANDDILARESPQLTIK